MIRAFRITGRKVPMKRVELTLITNKSLFARRAEYAGIDRIMIDLERFLEKPNANTVASFFFPIIMPPISI